MAGVIKGYQIVVVKLQPVLMENAAYIEHWSIELNGQKDRLLPLYVKGQVEWPNISIGYMNSLKFNDVHPGCEEIQVVPMKNLVSYPIK